MEVFMYAYIYMLYNIMDRNIESNYTDGQIHDKIIINDIQMYRIKCLYEPNSTIKKKNHRKRYALTNLHRYD